MILYTPNFRHKPWVSATARHLSFALFEAHTSHGSLSLLLAKTLRQCPSAQFTCLPFCQSNVLRENNNQNRIQQSSINKQILPSSKPISVKGLHLVVGLPENNWKKHRFPNLSGIHQATSPQPPEDFACPRPLRRPWHPCPSCWPGEVSKRGAGARWWGLPDNTPTIRYTKTDMT